jgi:hypothetical protein
VLAEVGVEAHAGRHRGQDGGHRLAPRHPQQEVGVGQRGTGRLRLEVRAPLLGVAAVELELLEDALEQGLELHHRGGVGGLGHRQGVGAGERAQEPRVLLDVEQEALPGQLARGDALHEGVVLTGRHQVAVVVEQLPSASHPHLLVRPWQETRGPPPRVRRGSVFVGQEGLEPSASPLSGVRSNRAELLALEWRVGGIHHPRPPQSTDCPSTMASRPAARDGVRSEQMEWALPASAVSVSTHSEIHACTRTVIEHRLTGMTTNPRPDRQPRRLRLGPARRPCVGRAVTRA